MASQKYILLKVTVTNYYKRAPLVKDQVCISLPHANGTSNQPCWGFHYSSFFIVVQGHHTNEADRRHTLVLASCHVGNDQALTLWRRAWKTDAWLVECLISKGDGYWCTIVRISLHYLVIGMVWTHCSRIYLSSHKKTYCKRKSISCKIQNCLMQLIGILRSS